jgi:PAS domain S-box-containing protein
MGLGANVVRYGFEAVHRTHQRGERALAAGTTVLAVAAVYFAAAKLGLSMAFTAKQVTAVWPPTGIALAAVLLLGPQASPGIALGAFFANLWTPHETPWTAGGIAMGNTLEAVLGAALLHGTGFRPSLERLRDVLALVVLAALTSTGVSATIGVTTLCAAGVHPWSAFGSLWSLWWIGDGIAALVVAPVLLVWAGARTVRPGAPRIVEAALVVAGVLMVALVVFAGRLGMPVTGYPLHYMVFPFVVWAALRFGQRGTTGVTLVTSVVAIWSTLNGWGPFATGSIDQSLIQLQLFMAIAAVTGLLLGAAIAERDLAEDENAGSLARVQGSEERLLLALDAGRMGVWDWNVRTGEVKWSENLEPIHGLAPGSFGGRFQDFQALIHPDDRARVSTAIEQALEHGTGYEIEFRNLWPDGSVHWMSAKGRVLRDERGQSARMIGVGMDVTDRRHLEEELRARADELARADRRKDEFLAMLGHELRNPLHAVRNAVVTASLDESRRALALEIAHRQADQLGRLIDDLLDVARITQGRITLRRQRVRLAEIIERAIESTRSFIEGRGVRLTVALPPDPIRLDADPGRLEQVFVNLLSNAAKYTEAGGRIDLLAEHRTDQAIIRIRDTGIGITAEMLPRIWSLFAQADRALDRAQGGLGIGLTVARRLVELHGGRIDAHSEGLGKGAEFVVTMRTSPVTSEEVPVGAAPEPVPQRAARVVLVEDNPDTAESVKMLLEVRGHRVRVAYDGIAALDATRANVPDVMLVDIGLPGMDGYEVARRVRQDPILRHVVLVALTGYGRDEDKERARAAGFDYHLTKPVDLDTLQGVVGRLGREDTTPPTPQ